MGDNKSDYKTIGEVAEILNLVNKKTGKKFTHTLRFWEKQFKQVKPKVFLGNRRYYDNQAIQTLKKIKFLLKHKGMTINGVKKLLMDKNMDVDVTSKISINPHEIKYKIIKISNLIKKLKNK